MAEQLFKKKSPVEERKYQEAVGLQESVSYIVRFERKVIVLNNAAKKFEALGDYKDSAERCKLCKKAAQEADETGCRQVFEQAKQKKEQAKSKSDYIEVIAEFKRVWKHKEYEKSAKKEIADCKEIIIRLEKKAIWKKRGITLAVLAACIFIFTQTIAYPFVKGVVHQQLGHYQAALNNFKVSQAIPGAGGKLRACYYHLGEESLKKGNKERAQKLFARAENYEDAAKKAAELEQEFLGQASEGERIAFGQEKWLVLEKKKGKVLLLCNKLDKKMVYGDKEYTVWEKTKVYSWLNSTFLSQTFSEEELALIAPLKSGEDEPNCAFLLSSKEYERTKERIPFKSKNWWLREEFPLSAREAEYVNTQGEVKKTYINNATCHIRPAIWVKIK